MRRFAAAMAVRENLAGDVLASLTTMQWNVPSKAWTGGATMADSPLNRRMTVRLGPAVAFAQIGVVGFGGQIELEALRLYGVPEDAAALPCGTPALPVGQREFAAEVAWDLPSLAPGATSLLDVTVTGCDQGDVADAALVSSSRFVELDAAAWSNTTVRVMARNISRSAFDLGAATLSVAVTKRRIREADDGADRGHVATDRFGRLREAELEADFVRCGSATRLPRGGDPPLPPHGASPSI